MIVHLLDGTYELFRHHFGRPDPGEFGATSAVLGNVLVFGGQVFYPVYAAGERAHGISPHADQNAAGAIMMIEGSILTLCLFGWLFARTAREGEERQELLELAAARGVELTEARAARAVAAGRGAELRRRIESGA